MAILLPPDGPRAAQLDECVRGPSRSVEMEMEHTAETGAVAPESHLPLKSEWQRAEVSDRLEHLKRYVYYQSCKNIGGEQVYIDFLRTRVRTGSIEAQTQLDSHRFIESTKEYVESCLDALSASGNPAVKTVCGIVAQQSRIPCTKCYFWTTCAISGATINTSLQISLDAPVYVSTQFEAFVYSYWMFKNIDTIEKERVSAYLAQNTIDLSVMTHIEHFSASPHYATDSDLELYEHATTFVVNTMCMSV
jgi:hypothetical protein